MIINGKIIEKTDQIAVTNPYNGEEVGRVSRCSKGDIEEAVKSAQKAFRTMKDLSPYKRSKIIESVTDVLKEEKENIARLITMENGKTLKESRVEVERALQTLVFSAEEAKRVNGESIPADVTPVETGRDVMTLLEPIGVVAAISPFNYPLNLVVHKVGPALAAGNSTIIKPATETPLTSYELGKFLLKTDLPAGALSVISGRGRDIGESLVKSDVDMISFTGSVEVGKRICRMSGMKKLSLELGGNGPLIVMADSDTDAAISAAVDGAFGTAGQRCTAVKRVLLQKEIAEEFTEKFVKEAKRLVVGDPMNEDTDIGPLINDAAVHEVERRVKDAEEKGAEILCGGDRENNNYWPTVLKNIPSGAEIVRTETFGPVAPLIEFRDIKEAVEIANETGYGLQAGFFSDNFRDIKYAYHNLRTGAVIVNGPPGFRLEHLPFGGIKESGLGREGVKYAVREMTEIKTVVL